ncbi:hypothetical protein JTE90_014677 [Oedothorax gibbosus]|uniref:Centrosomin N-terminal motif 1 domain-containing protein n=1 Tax=Oedothorax gibbosus TaxID=931172 RepID=A0AAV6UHB1_9ARAC|nr:hypothetical protein JTE90_014677 [Oedothorax gibbosus]
MDLVNAQELDIPRGAVSPLRETRTLAVREYEECIAELKKENFDLKLQLYLKDQSRPKNWKRDVEEDDQTVTVQIVVDLQNDIETLKKELSNKDQLLQDALSQSEELASHVQELQKKFVESQEQIPLECQKLKEDKEICEQEIEFFKNVLTEKDAVIQEANAQIEELSSQIEVLGAKVKRRSIALQGLVYKYHNDVETIPKELRPFLQTAVQAAKTCKEEELNSAIRELKASLHKLMSLSSQERLDGPEQDENQDPSCTKNNSVTELHNSSAAQEEVSLPSQQKDSKPKFVHVSEDLSSTNGKILSQSLESIDESVKSFDSKESDNIEYMLSVLKDYEQLKCDSEEKKTIQDLNSTDNELDRKNIQLQSDLKEAISKVKLLETKFKDEYVERKNLENRLNLSNQVNHDLMEHLRKLETFLEDLLQNKNMDSSIMESFCETSEVLSRLASFLDDTRRLSIGMSDQISGTLKSPFVCKKCQSQPQFPDNLADRNQLKIVVNDIHKKFDTQQKNLEELNENDGSKAKGMDIFSKEKLELIKELEEELKKLKIENEEFALKLSEYTIEKDKFQIVVDDLRNTCNNQENKIKELNDIYSKTAKEVDNFSKEKLEHVSHIKELEEELRELKNKEEEFAFEMTKYTREKDELQIEVEDLRNTCNNQENKIKELNDIYSKTAKEVDNFSKEKLEHVSHIKELEEELNLLKNKEEDKLQERDICEELKVELDKAKKSLQNLDKKCIEYKMELSISTNSIEEHKNKSDKLEERLIHKTKEIEALSEERLKLLSFVNALESDVKKSKIREEELTQLSSESSIKLNEYSSENVKLRNTIKALESKAKESDSICDKLKQELRETKLNLQNLDEKCSVYEVELLTSANSLEDYKQKYNNVEKEKLELISSKNELLQSIQDEKVKVQQILSAKNNLEEEFKKKSEYMNALQSQYSELETKSSKLLEEKEKQLLNSNSICAELKQQFEKSNESFKNMNRLHTSSKEKAQKYLKFQEEAKEYLLKVKIILLKNIQHLKEFQQYLDSEEEGFQDVDTHNYLSGKNSITDEDEKVDHQFTNIITLNTKFEKILCDTLSSVKSTQETMKVSVEKVNMEIESLKTHNSHLSAQIELQKLLESENKTLLKKSKSEVDDLQQDLQNTQNELKATKSFVKNMEAYAEQLKQSLDDNEKSLKQSKAKLSSSEAKLDLMQKQAKKHRDSLSLKDKVISELQSKVLKTQNELTDVLLEKRTLASQVKMSAHEQSESLETELAEAKQQIDILEKEKGHLREHLLAQVRKEKNPNHSSKDFDCLKKELSDLQGQLQDKSLYIKELKTNMGRTCNALENKPKEVDDLRCKLSESQVQSTETKLIIEEAEIKLNPLKKYKQELIQGILGQQKQFYEHRNISLEHLEKFQLHIEKLHSFCSQTSKLSEPFWSTSMDGNSSYAEKWKETVNILKTELELDVECLQNINVFLKRFVIPLVLQDFKQSERKIVSSSKHSLSETEQMVSSSRKLSVETDIFTGDQISNTTSDEVVCSRSENSLNDRLIPTTYALSHKIESMDDLLKSVKPLLKNIKKKLSSEEAPKLAKCTSSLQKLSEKIVKLQEKTDEIFHISDALKSLLQPDIPQIVNQEEERSQESLFQRSLFSSPDLAIEPDQFNKSFASETAERYRSASEGKCSDEKQASLGQIDSSTISQISDHVIDSNDTLHAIGVLRHFEFLKKEVQKSLAGIKSVISRAKYGLDLVADCTSPRKNLEFSTFEAIKETGENIAACLEEACKLVGKFRIAHYSSSDELNQLIQHNLEMQEELKSIFDSKLKQERYFDEAMAKLKQTERAKERMDKKIAKKLVKTKKVLRHAEVKLLEGVTQDLPSLPKK